MNLSDKNISKQESLTSQRLDVLCGSKQIPPIRYHANTRPEASLINLIGWTKDFLFHRDEILNDWEVFIHNKITIDGAFFQFCKEKKANIETLHTDAITSWKNSYNNEQFIAAGIFKITKDDLEFYHCGLFHKGNDNEDEVSFFVFVKKGSFDKYVSFRDSFDKWQNKRERDSLEIEVIGGNPISYKTDLSWDDLFLSDSLKEKIINSVEGFLKSKKVYDRLKVPWRRGIGFWGPAGVGKTSALRLLMSEYSEFKPITVQSGHSAYDELLEEAFSYAEKHAPALLFFEDLQEMMKTIDVRNFLQLLDGLQTRDGILTIVTGNDFSELEENLRSRPRRFDGFLEFPLPDLVQTKKYLSKLFSDVLTKKDIDTIAKKTVKHRFSYAHLQEIYFNSVFIAIPAGRDFPESNDVKLSLKQVIEEKKAADSNFTKGKRDLTDDLEEEDDEREDFV